MTQPACGACGAPTGDQATLCGTCTTQLEDTLAAAAELGLQLDIALSRQARFTEHHGGTSGNQPLPYDVRASEAIEQLAMVLRGWEHALNLPQSAA